MKLSDTQLTIMSAASQRTDRIVILPEKLRGGSAQALIGKLLKEKLLEEVLATSGMPIWRRGKDNKPLALRITSAGLKAIRVEGEPSKDKSVSADPLTNPRNNKQTKSAKTAKAQVTRPPSKGESRETKQSDVLSLLRKPGGATLDALVKATGWQRHSVRGFLAGTIRGKLKLPLVSEHIDGVRTYRIGAARSAGKLARRRSA